MATTDLAELLIRVDSTQLDELNRNLGELTDRSIETERRTERISSSFSSMNSVIRGLAPLVSSLVGAFTFAKASEEILRVARETQNFKAQLKTMTGSMENANEAFDRLNKFATTTPYTLQQSIDGFVKLKALGLDPSERAMTSYGNTAAAMGKDLQQMIEAVADASTGEFERLKEFGIKASKNRDEVTFTFQGVETTIKNSSENIQQYLLNIGEVNFATAMADQMNTIDGQLSNLDMALDDLWRALGEGLNVTDNTSASLAFFSDILIDSTEYVRSLGDIIDLVNDEITVFTDDIKFMFGLLDGSDQVTNLSDDFNLFSQDIKRATDDFILFEQTLAEHSFDFLISSIRDIPINFRAAIGVMIGEYLKFKNEVDSQSEILWIKFKKGFGTIGDFVTSVWLSIKLAFMQMIDGVINTLASKINTMGTAIGNLPFMDSVSEKINAAADALTAFGDNSASVKAEITALYGETNALNNSYDDQIDKIILLKNEREKSFDTAIGGYLMERNAAIEASNAERELNAEFRQTSYEMRDYGKASKEVVEVKKESDKASGKLSKAENKLSKEVKKSVKNQKDVKKALKETGLTNKQVTDDMFNAWNKLNENIQAEFINRFTDMLMGAKDSFKGFAESILKMWVNTTLNMAFDPNIGPANAISTMTGGIFGGGSGGVGGSGGFGGFSLSNLTSAFKSGFGPSPILDVTSMLGFGNTSAVGPVQPMFADGGFATSSLASMGYGLGGSLIGGLISDNKYGSMAGGLGGSIGGTLAAGSAAAGGMMAQFGAFAGPMGMLAGAILGGAIDKVFGDKEAKTELTGYIGSDPNNPWVQRQQGLDTWLSKQSGQPAISLMSELGNMALGIGHTGNEGQMSDEEALKLAGDLQKQMGALVTLDKLLIDTFNLTSGEIEKIKQATERGEIETNLTSTLVQDLIVSRYNSILTNIDNEALKAAQSIAGGSQFTDVQTLTAQLIAAGIIQNLDTSLNLSVNDIADRLGMWTKNIEITSQDFVKELNAASELLYLEFNNTGFKMFMSDINELKMTGTLEETASQVLTLGNNLLAVNDVLPTINQEIFSLDYVGAKLAERMLELSGGLDAWTKKTSFYYENFFTEQERVQDTYDRTTQQINDFNATWGTSILSPQSLREVKESLDLTTESGLQLDAALLDLAPVVLANEQAMTMLKSTLVDVGETTVEVARTFNNVSAQLQNTVIDSVAEFSTQKAKGLIEERWYGANGLVQQGNAYLGQMGLRGQYSLSGSLYDIKDTLNELLYYGATNPDAVDVGAVNTFLTSVKSDITKLESMRGVNPKGAIARSPTIAELTPTATEMPLWQQSLNAFTATNSLASVGLSVRNNSFASRGAANDASVNGTVSNASKDMLMLVEKTNEYLSNISVGTLDTNNHLTLVNENLDRLISVTESGLARVASSVQQSTPVVITRAIA